jgi:hypothetical protein
MASIVVPNAEPEVAHVFEWTIAIGHDGEKLQ